MSITNTNIRWDKFGHFQGLWSRLMGPSAIAYGPRWGEKERAWLLEDVSGAHHDGLIIRFKNMNFDHKGWSWWSEKNRFKNMISEKCGWLHKNCWKPCWYIQWRRNPSSHWYTQVDRKLWWRWSFKIEREAEIMKLYLSWTPALLTAPRKWFY